MTVAEVLAQHIWQAYVVELGHSMPEGLADQLAAAVVPGLKADGWAVVELPKRTFIPTAWEGCLGAWPGPDGEDPVSAWPKGRVVTHNDEWLSVADARALAAALLAAAERAE